jgi:ubiquinol-cytochrome c reductase cytochrome c subunit
VLDRRAAAGLTALAVVVLLGWLMTAGPLGRGRIPGADRRIAAAAQVSGPSGEALYVSSCAACHGITGAGTPDGPALTGAGAATTDFMLQTGRMPLAAPGDPVRRARPAFSQAEIAAIVDYVAGLGSGPAIPRVQVDSATDIAAGRAAYIATCAACHGAGGSGDAVGGGAAAPPLLDTAPTQVGEAIRIGPGAMPAFDPRQISDAQLGEIAAYLRFLRDDSARGGAAIGGVGPVAEGYVGWLVYLVLLLGVARWIERRHHA